MAKRVRPGYPKGYTLYTSEGDVVYTKGIRDLRDEVARRDEVIPTIYRGTTDLHFTKIIESGKLIVPLESLTKPEYRFYLEELHGYSKDEVRCLSSSQKEKK